MPEKKDTKKMNVAVETDLMPWMSYAAGVIGTSVTGYINDAIRRDMEGADPLGTDKTVTDGYGAFMAARDKHGRATE